MASTKSDEATLSSFRFDAIGVVMGMHYIILNLFRISTTYFPCPHLRASKVVRHIQVLHLEVDIKSPSCNFNEFLFSVRNKSSTYNRSITGVPPSTLEKRLESTLLSVNPRAISNLSILTYHIKTEDLLQSLPMKQSINIPLSFILYAMKHSLP